jgi:hypothetical protein
LFPVNDRQGLDGGQTSVPDLTITLEWEPRLAPNMPSGERRQLGFAKPLQTLSANTTNSSVK